jgi:hypothetical protein
LVRSYAMDGPGGVWRIADKRTGKVIEGEAAVRDFLDAKDASDVVAVGLKTPASESAGVVSGDAGSTPARSTMSEDIVTPNPGSPEAVADGCTCPVIDNRRGVGGIRGPGTFVFNTDCPLHGATWRSPSSCNTGGHGEPGRDQA